MVNRIARMLQENGAVEYGEFTLASGAKSSYYLDVKSALANPSVLKAVGEEIAGMASFDLVAGVAVGGVPIAVATSLASGKPYAIIRALREIPWKSRANHRKSRRNEGASR